MAIPFLDKILGSVVDKAGGIIQELVRDKDLAAKLEHELKAQLSSQDHEIQVLEQQLEKDMFQAQQETIQAELHQNDTYTKRTRPSVARKSFYAGLLYVLLGNMPEAGLWGFMPWQFDWTVLMLLYSPALTYMGVRGFEKWKAGGAK